jgi:hypothetical protein
MRAIGMSPSDHLYHHLLLALCASEEYEEVFRLWEEYLATGMRPAQQIFNSVILAYSKTGHFDKALKVTSFHLTAPPHHLLSCQHSSRTEAEPLARRDGRRLGHKGSPSCPQQWRLFSFLGLSVATPRSTGSAPSGKSRHRRRAVPFSKTYDPHPGESTRRAVRVRVF